MDVGDDIFENREKDIETIAESCVKNFLSIISPQTRASDYKPILLIISQMLGSGKTGLGAAFMREIKVQHFKRPFNICRKNLIC